MPHTSRTTVRRVQIVQVQRQVRPHHRPIHADPDTASVATLDRLVEQFPPASAKPPWIVELSKLPKAERNTLRQVLSINDIPVASKQTPRTSHAYRSYKSPNASLSPRLTRSTMPHRSLSSCPQFGRLLHLLCPNQLYDERKLPSTMQFLLKSGNFSKWRHCAGVLVTCCIRKNLRASATSRTTMRPVHSNQVVGLQTGPKFDMHILGYVRSLDVDA